MRKILLVARRDFLATVTTKGFIIAIMVPVVTFGAIILAFPRMMNNRVPAVTGTVAVIDRTGQVVPGIRRYLDPQAMADAPRRVVQSRDRIQPDGRHAGGRRRRGRRSAPSSVSCRISRLPNRRLSALDEQKERLTQDAAHRQLAVLVVHPNAVLPNDEGIFGAYDLFVRRNLDNRIQNGDSQCGCRSDRRCARARGGTGPAAHRRAHQSGAPAVDDGHRRQENLRREPISPGCCRWGSPFC